MVGWILECKRASRGQGLYDSSSSLLMVLASMGGFFPSGPHFWQLSYRVIRILHAVVFIVRCSSIYAPSNVTAPFRKHGRSCHIFWMIQLRATSDSSPAMVVMRLINECSELLSMRASFFLASGAVRAGCRWAL